MNMVELYVIVLHDTLEKISRKLYSKKGRKYNSLSNEIDRELLKKYRIIEDMIDKELSKK